MLYRFWMGATNVPPCLASKHPEPAALCLHSTPKRRFKNNTKTLENKHTLTDTYSSYVSPRKRAQRTFELLNLGISGDLPWEAHGQSTEQGLQCDAKVQVTDAVREWDYGDYEGITSPDIGKIRAAEGIQGTWDIWRDGCPGGEYADAMQPFFFCFRVRWLTPS